MGNAKNVLFGSLYLVVLAVVWAKNVESERCKTLQEQCLENCAGLAIDFECEEKQPNSISSACACISTGSDESSVDFEEKALPVEDSNDAPNTLEMSCEQLEILCQESCYYGDDYVFNCKKDDSGSAMTSASSCSCVADEGLDVVTTEPVVNTSETSPLATSSPNVENPDSRIRSETERVWNEDSLRFELEDAGFAVFPRKLQMVRTIFFSFSAFLT